MRSLPTEHYTFVTISLCRTVGVCALLGCAGVFLSFTTLEHISLRVFGDSKLLPISTAIALLLWVSYAIVGACVNLLRSRVAIVVLFETPVAGTMSFYHAVATNLRRLDKIAQSSSLVSLSEFGFETRLLEQAPSQWHDSKAGVACVQRLIEQLPAQLTELRDELSDLEQRLTLAVESGSRFRLMLYHELGDSALSWQRRHVYL